MDWRLASSVIALCSFAEHVLSRVEFR
jgi:hypothetical protein